MNLGIWTEFWSSLPSLRFHKLVIHFYLSLSLSVCLYLSLSLSFSLFLSSSLCLSLSLFLSLSLSFSLPLYVSLSLSVSLSCVSLLCVSLCTFCIPFSLPLSGSWWAVCFPLKLLLKQQGYFLGTPSLILTVIIPLSSLNLILIYSICVTENEEKFRTINWHRTKALCGH